MKVVPVYDELWMGQSHSSHHHQAPWGISTRLSLIWSIVHRLTCEIIGLVTLNIFSNDNDAGPQSQIETLNTIAHDESFCSPITDF